MELRKNRRRFWQRNKWWRYLLIGIAVVVAALLIYHIPPVYERLSWRLDELRTRIIYFFSPPSEAIFIPEEQNRLETVVQATQSALSATATPSPTPTATDPANTLLPTPTATITSTPLPESVQLEGVVYIDQHNRWNYCGPANLAMGLSFWGWQGIPGNDYSDIRDDIASVVKPGVQDPDLDFIQGGRWDKNVMPYEMVNFVADYTDLNVVARSGGDLDLLKKLLANGYPVIVEKGYYEADYTGKVAWLGHYQFITGYDEAKGVMIVQDAYLDNGNNLETSYEVFIEGWRSFNYLFMVIYPPEQESQVFELLGAWGDPAWADRHALEIAEQEILDLSGIDQFFAWFNKGTGHVELLEYGDAAQAYDQAFALYAALGDDDTERPYRIMWYQTGPYWAYYYTGRYNDVINLADNTLNETIAEPTLEESLYWRGLAREALGNLEGAIADYRESVRLNPNFSPGWAQLERLGVSG